MLSLSWCISRERVDFLPGTAVSGLTQTHVHAHGTCTHFLWHETFGRGVQAVQPQQLLLSRPCPSLLPHFVVRLPFLLRGLRLPERRLGAPFAVDDAEEHQSRGALRSRPSLTAIPLHLRPRPSSARSLARFSRPRNSSQSQSFSSGFALRDRDSCVPLKEIFSIHVAV